MKDYAIFMLTPVGHVATWNAGGERIKGYGAEVTAHSERNAEKACASVYLLLLIGLVHSLYAARELAFGTSSCGESNATAIPVERLTRLAPHERFCLWR